MSFATLGSPAHWALFFAFVLAMLALDLGVLHRKVHAVGLREATIASAVWVSLALAFAGLVSVAAGREVATEFLTAYLVEKSLSVDNLFVFVLIFGALRIPLVEQHRVLFWGILGALAMRAAMIVGGVALLERYHFLVYVFGAILVYAGGKMLLDWWRGSDGDTDVPPFLARVRSVIPTTERLEGHRFFVRERGALLATPLFVALVLVELADVVFALDSIPAIFGVTRDPFVVFTSNVFAILGLRSLYFVVVGAVEKLHDVKLGLAAVLVFVGAKSALGTHFHLSPLASLGIVVALLVGSLGVGAVRRKLAGAAETALPPPEKGSVR